MTEHTPLEREVAAIIADTLDEHTTLDTNRYTSVIWQIAEAVIKEVSTAEQERIIALLKSKIHWVQHEGSMPNTLEDPTKIIALIKGENK